MDEATIIKAITNVNEAINAIKNSGYITKELEEILDQLFKRTTKLNGQLQGIIAKRNIKILKDIIYGLINDLAAIKNKIPYENKKEPIEQFFVREIQLLIDSLIILLGQLMEQLMEQIMDRQRQLMIEPEPEPEPELEPELELELEPEPEPELEPELELELEPEPELEPEQTNSDDCDHSL